MLMLAIEFCVERPQGGVRFIHRQPFETTDPSNVYVCTVDRSMCSWFPCINSSSELCTWKIEVLVEAELSVVASGNLVEVESLTRIVHQDTSAMSQLKRYHFFMHVPTCAANIGVVLGQFDTSIDENVPEVSYFFDTALKSLVKDTCSFISELLEFYEETLSFHFPFGSFKLIFVPDLAENFISFSSLTVANVNLLHSERIIEQAIESRRLLASLVAEQFFGCFISAQSQHDWWLTTGLSQFLAGLYLKKLMGNNEYKFMIYQSLKDVCKYEREQGHVVLDFNRNQTSMKEVNARLVLSQRYHLMGCPEFYRVAEKKAHLVVRLVDEHLGRDLMVQILNRLLSRAQDAVKNKCRTSLNLSTDSFLDTLVLFSTKDIRQLLELWVFKPGVARFNCSFSFNRKKNMIELEIKQEMSNQKGYRKYSGPITLIVQETEGSFTHSLHIESDQVSSKFEVACHSKGKRNKKKKIPLITGEEVDIDTSQNESDSPIIWLRLDSDLKILRDLSLDQPDHNWQNELRFERDICAQLDAVETLSRFATSQVTRTALLSVIESPECFYRVRIRAAQVLADVYNRIVHSWNGPLALIPTFKKFFMSSQCQQIVTCNNFSDLQMYFIQKALPVAMGSMRNSHNLCPSDVIRFLLDLIKFNENGRNSYSDGNYRACLIDALGATISTSVASVVQTDGLTKSSALSQDMRAIVEEIVLRLNLEKIFPSNRFVITCSCLRALRNLQKHGHLPEDIDKFKEYALYENNFEDVRLVAFEIIIEYLAVRNDQNLLDWLLDFVESDPSYKIKQSIVQNMTKYPPFKANSDETPLNNESLVNRLWSLMNKFNYNNSLKANLSELYQILYGLKNPKCLRHTNKQTLKIGNIEPLQMNTEN